MHKKIDIPSRCHGAYLLCVSCIFTCRNNEPPAIKKFTFGHTHLQHIQISWCDLLVYGTLLHSSRYHPTEIMIRPLSSRASIKNVWCVFTDFVATDSTLLLILFCVAKRHFYCLENLDMHIMRCKMIIGLIL
jgi:hypothetical protein